MKNDAIELNQDIVAEKIFKLESEIMKQSAQIETMNTQIIQLQSELNENKLLIERNEIAATIEREKLTDEIEQYRSMIELMNAQIDRLENTSYQMVGASLLTSQQESNDELLGKLAAYEKLFTENMNNSSAILPENNNVDTIGESMEIVSNDATSNRMESYNKMVAENVAKSNEENIEIHENNMPQTKADQVEPINELKTSDTPKINEMVTLSEYHIMVKQLKDEISKLLAENVELTDMVSAIDK